MRITSDGRAALATELAALTELVRRHGRGNGAAGIHLPAPGVLTTALFVDDGVIRSRPAGRGLPAVSRRRDLGLVTNRHQVVLRSLPTASPCH